VRSEGMDAANKATEMTRRDCRAQWLFSLVDDYTTRFEETWGKLESPTGFLKICTAASEI
jgi:hypothetical protein